MRDLLLVTLFGSIVCLVILKEPIPAIEAQEAEAQVRIVDEFIYIPIELHHFTVCVEHPSSDPMYSSSQECVVAGDIVEPPEYSGTDEEYVP